MASLTSFDELELAIQRRAPLTRDDTENMAALQTVRNTTPHLRQRVASALADLSNRIDPTMSGGQTHVTNN